jgi:hypothetical protein
MICSWEQAEPRQPCSAPIRDPELQAAIRPAPAKDRPQSYEALRLSGGAKPLLLCMYMSYPPLSPAQVYTLLGWIGGAASTAVAALFASKVRVYEDQKKAHLEDIKERVLKPIRAGFHEHFGLVISGQEPIVFVHRGATEFLDNAKVTEAQKEERELLATAFPGVSVFGGVDSALLQDATRNHFRDLAGRIDSFVMECSAYGAECHSWTAGMAEMILKRSCLCPYPPKGTGPGPRFYVMHNRLAVFIFRRLYRMSAPGLIVEETNSGWGLHGETATLAFGEKSQVQSIADYLDGLLQSEADHARQLQLTLGKLQQSYNALMAELDFVIAARRLRKRCDLVPFF